MSKKRQNYQHKADVLFSQQIRARDGVCQAAGLLFECRGTLQCAHIISRRYGPTRCDEANALALCASHHIYWTHRPLEWEDFIESRKPGEWQRLRVKAMSRVKVDWKSVYESLKGTGLT